MKEIEIKFLEVNADELKSKLIDLGAVEVNNDDIHAIMYDFEGHTLHKDKKLLRLRKVGDKVELTFKHKLSNNGAVVAEETEVEVSDFNTTKLILEKAGFIIRREIHKHRHSFKLNDSRYEFDTMKDENIPTFLEIESPSTEALKEAAELIGLNFSEGKAWTGNDILKHYKEK